jgi:hypothetical protein
MPAISLDDKAALTIVFTDAKKIEIGVTAKAAMLSSGTPAFCALRNPTR